MAAGANTGGAFTNGSVAVWERGETSPGNCAMDGVLAPWGKIWDCGLSTTVSRAGSCIRHATMPALPSATTHNVQTIVALRWMPMRATGLVADRARRLGLSTKGTDCVI